MDRRDERHLRRRPLAALAPPVMAPLNRCFLLALTAVTACGAETVRATPEIKANVGTGLSSMSSAQIAFDAMANLGSLGTHALDFAGGSGSPIDLQAGLPVS